MLYNYFSGHIPLSAIALIWSCTSHGKDKSDWGLLVAGQPLHGQCVNLLESMKVVLIKIGGSSITDKAQKETLNEKALSWFGSSLAQSISLHFLAPLDNSQSDTQLLTSNYLYIGKENRTEIPTAYIVVHGAGSFGHHSAKEYGLKGQTQPSQSTTCNSVGKNRYAMQGLAQTRRSVQKLNGAVVSALLDNGINAVGISPCFGIPGIEASGCVDNTAETTIHSIIYSTLISGIVPVLHGDACLYGHNDAGILSGDTIMEVIGKAPWISRALFITDVDGVFTSDPRLKPDAQLIRSIAVDGRTGEIRNFAFDVTGSSHDHDVTGGLKTKLASAASIAANGINVTIARFGSDSARRAMAVEHGIDRATILYRTED